MLDAWSWIWWRWIPGVIVTVPWPKERPFDPDVWYRPWLEQHVGRKHWHWDWQFYGYFEGGRYGSRPVIDSVKIKLCWSKKQYASYMALKWAAPVDRK